MPIYEYYCAGCHGRFQHLAKRMDAPPPPCPRCGNRAAQRMVSAVNVVHGAAQHEQVLRREAKQVDAENPRAIAQFLQQSGRLTDAEGLYGSPVYQELLRRRAAGAGDAEVGDLVEGLVAQMRASDTSQMAAAMALSEAVENRMQAEGPPEDHDHETPPARASQRSADNLGWA